MQVTYQGTTIDLAPPWRRVTLNDLVYKILPRSEAEGFRAVGSLVGSQLDQRDGYIHLSTAPQLRQQRERLLLQQRPPLAQAAGAAGWRRWRSGDRRVVR